jgi:hypothetical protein
MAGAGLRRIAVEAGLTEFGFWRTRRHPSMVARPFTRPFIAVAWAFRGSASDVDLDHRESQLKE